MSKYSIRLHHKLTNVLEPMLTLTSKIRPHVYYAAMSCDLLLFQTKIWLSSTENWTWPASIPKLKLINVNYYLVFSPYTFSFLFDAIKILVSQVQTHGGVQKHTSDASHKTDFTSICLVFIRAVALTRTHCQHLGRFCAIFYRNLHNTYPHVWRSKST